jgi:protein TonB
VFTPTQTARPNRWITGSLAAHALVLGVLLFHFAPHLTNAERPGTTHGHEVLLTYLPGTANAVTSAIQTPHPETIAAPAHQAIPTPSKAPDDVALPAPDSTSANTAATGNDALGSGDVTLALVDLHPPPKPNLDQLPANTHGDVVVDIIIDPLGHISQFKLIRGLGPTVDQTVLATIQNWTFHPATRNGAPVASEQELLFHYDHA